MKYTIHGYSQKELIEKKLTGDDAMILRWFSDYAATGRMSKKILDGEIFYFVKYNAIIEEFPILGIKSSDAMSKRLTKLVKSGILEKRVMKKGGIFPYFRLNPDEYQKLISSTPVQKSDKPDINSDHPKLDLDHQDQNSDPSEISSGTNLNPSINPETNPSTKKRITEKNQETDLFSEFWKNYPLKKGKVEAEKLFPGVVKKIGIEKLNAALKNYLEEIERKKIKPEYISHGSRFLRGRYEDYFPENYSIPGKPQKETILKCYTWESVDDRVRKNHESKEKYIEMWEMIAKRERKTLVWEESPWKK